MSIKMDRVCVMTVMAAILLSTAGCSAMQSTPRTARIHVQQLNNKLVEYVIHLENPNEANKGIHLSNRLTLHLDFQWLLNIVEPEQQSLANQQRYIVDPPLTPWVLWECKY